MNYYAEVVNGLVTKVIVAEESFIATRDGMWIKCSENDYPSIGDIHNQDGTFSRSPDSE